MQAFQALAETSACLAAYPPLCPGCYGSRAHSISDVQSQPPYLASSFLESWLLPVFMPTPEQGAIPQCPGILSKASRLPTRMSKISWAWQLLSERSWLDPNPACPAVSASGDE